MNCTIGKAIVDVIAERKRQDNKWGEKNHKPEKWVAILGEEFGELCQSVVETIFDNPVPDGGVYAGGFDNIRKEAIHVAAVAVAMVECIDRYGRQNWDVKIGFLK